MPIILTVHPKEFSGMEPTQVTHTQSGGQSTHRVPVAPTPASWVNIFLKLVIAVYFFE